MPPLPVLAIGDVHGCLATLDRLLEGARRHRERCWFVGDLVNRGPESAGVLRRVRDLGGVAVLGNHDLRLIALHDGIGDPSQIPDLHAVLQADDATDLIEWLAARPLLHREGSRLLVHAGLHPSWTADDAVTHAREAEEALRGPSRRCLLAALRDTPAWDDRLRGIERHAAAIGVLTRLRACTRDGEELSGFTDHPDRLPDGGHAWFDVPDRASADAEVVFGHWAALGLVIRPDCIALDTGCAWGRELTAVCLPDRTVHRQARLEPLERGL